MTPDLKRKIEEMASRQGVPGKCNMCFIEGAEAMFKLMELNSIHTCHENCSNRLCAATRRIQALEAREKKLREACEYAKKQFEVITPNYKHLSVWQCLIEVLAETEREA